MLLSPLPTRNSLTSPPSFLPHAFLWDTWPWNKRSHLYAWWQVWTSNFNFHLEQDNRHQRNKASEYISICSPVPLASVSSFSYTIWAREPSVSKLFCLDMLPRKWPVPCRCRRGEWGGPTSVRPTIKLLMLQMEQIEETKLQNFFYGYWNVFIETVI